MSRSMGRAVGGSYLKKSWNKPGHQTTTAVRLESTSSHSRRQLGLDTMNRHNFIWALAACLIACACANSYGGQQSYSSGGQQSYSSSGQGYGSEGSDGAAAAASSGGAGEYGSANGLGDGANAGAIAGDAAGVAQANQGSYGSDQNIPYKPVNTKGNTLTSSITYPQNKGEILIHRPAPIIVRRPPTKVLVNHPPLVVKPAPVVLHKPPAIVLRKVYVKHHPRRVKVEPVFVNVVKPPAEKYFVNENKQGYGQGSHGASSGSGLSSGPGPIVSGPRSHGSHSHGGQAIPAYASGADSAAVSAGYQLLQGGNHGLSALANIAGERDGQYGGHSQQYGGQSQQYGGSSQQYGGSSQQYGGSSQQYGGSSQQYGPSQSGSGAY
ncbi:Cp38 [Drosophila busckii]|uniref:Cp38 n=1 Tax=Drosophila busckii TaxID=30019 RepID=A0A0M4FAA8_DROBS|nr:chorion protein S38 [Drosophila busckii]ALC49320.1 Cp38 [Drosophila busckii]